MTASIFYLGKNPILALGLRFFAKGSCWESWGVLKEDQKPPTKNDSNIEFIIIRPISTWRRQPPSSLKVSPQNSTLNPRP